MSTSPARTVRPGARATAPWSPGLLVVLSLGVGCNWISEADYKAVAESLDNDGDKVTADDGDCDDSDPARYPGAEEIWYDGIDSDCAGDDDYDADKDNWVAAEYEGLATQGAPGTGGLRAGDCDDQDPTVNPAAIDTWYDGVDTDCAGNDDNDADGDGHASADYGGDDCYDADANVSPSATEIWLDGVDSDCSGGSDFDADGDGYAPTGLDSRTTLYAPEAPVLPDGDCDDEDPGVNEAAAEVYYDGKDNDCDPLTVDNDQDGDGFEVGGATEEDCDDEDPDVFPGADEVIGDSTDYDCDGGASTFADSAIAEAGPLFDPTGTFAATGLQELQVGAGPAHLWFAVGAETLTLPLASGSETAHSAIVAFGVPLDDSSRGIVRRQYLVYHPQAPTAYTVSDHFGFAVTTAPGSGGTAADLLLAAHGLHTGTDRSLRIAGYNERTDQSLGADVELAGSDTYTDFSVQLGLFDRVHAVGCTAGGDLDIVSGDLSSGTGDLTTGDLRTDASQAGEGGVRCALDTFDDPNISVVRTLGVATADRVTYNRDSPGGSVTTAETFTGIVADHVDVAEGGANRAIVLVASDGSVHVADDNGTETVTGVSASGPVRAMVTGDTRGIADPDYILAGVHPDGTGWFALGNNTDGYTPYDIVSGDGADAVQAVAWLDEDGRLHTFVETTNGLRYGSANY